MAWRFKFPYNLIQSNATVRTFIRKKATSFSINCGLFFITCHFLDISPVRFPLSICALFWAAWLHWCTNHFLNATYWVNVVIVNHDSLETGLLDQALKSLFRFHPIGLRSFAVSAGNLCFRQLFLLSLFFLLHFLHADRWQESKQGHIFTLHHFTQITLIYASYEPPLG